MQNGAVNLQGGMLMFGEHSSQEALKHDCVHAVECTLLVAVMFRGRYSLEGFHRDSSVPVK